MPSRRSADTATVLTLASASTAAAAAGTAGVAVDGVDLVEHGHGRDLALRQLGQDLLLELAPLPRLGDDHAQVGAVEHLHGAPGPQLAERAHVVEAGRVDEQHRAEGQQLHGLLHRVGGGARLLRHDGHVLPGDGVQQAGLAHVAPPEEGDVQAHAAWGVVEAG